MFQLLFGELVSHFKVAPQYIIDASLKPLSEQDDFEDIQLHRGCIQKIVQCRLRYFFVLMEPLTALLEQLQISCDIVRHQERTWHINNNTALWRVDEFVLRPTASARPCRDSVRNIRF